MTSINQLNLIKNGPSVTDGKSSMSAVSQEVPQAELVSYNPEALTTERSIAGKCLVANQTVGEKTLEQQNDFNVTIRGKNILVKRNGLSDAKVEKFKEAIKIINESGWLDEDPTSLRWIQGIDLKEGLGYRGLATGTMHWSPIINIEDSYLPEEIAATLIHEDRHNISNKQPLNAKLINRFEIDNDIGKVIEHSWVEKKDESGNITEKSSYPMFVLDELQAYGEGSKFILHLIEKRGFDPIVQHGLITQLFKDSLQAKEAIIKLKYNPQYLNKEGQKWLACTEKLWNNLDKKISPFWCETIGMLSKSDDAELRRHYYSHLDDLHKQFNSNTSHALEMFIERINQESDIFTLSLIGNNNHYTPQFQALAKQRFFEEVTKTLSTSQDSDLRHKCYLSLDSIHASSNSNDSSALNMFAENINQESDVLILYLIGSGNYYTPQFRTLAKQRFLEETTKTLSASQDISTRYTSYTRLDSMHKAFTDNDSLEIFTKHINQESNTYLLYLIATNESCSSQFQALAKQRFSEESIQNNFINLINTRLKGDDEQHKNAYLILGDGYNTCVDQLKLSYHKMFYINVSNETNIALLNELSQSERIPPELQEIIKQRLNQLSSSNP